MSNDIRDETIRVKIHDILDVVEVRFAHGSIRWCNKEWG